MPPQMHCLWTLVWDFSTGLIISAMILTLFAHITGKLETMDAQEYHNWRDGPQILLTIVGALMRQALLVFSSSYPS